MEINSRRLEVESRSMLFVLPPLHEGPGLVNALVPPGLELSLGDVISVSSPCPSGL